MKAQFGQPRYSVYVHQRRKILPSPQRGQRMRRPRETSCLLEGGVVTRSPGEGAGVDDVVVHGVVVAVLESGAVVRLELERRTDEILPSERDRAAGVVGAGRQRSA